jgi:cyclopropane fatty-acyl-phospholipid synthase-like methyltransferase
MNDVAKYYDENTSWFLRIDPSKARVIHRPVWASGVTTLRDAAHYVHAQIAAAAPATKRLLDLGCGVGESTFWLSERLAAETVGVSISQKQIAIALAAARERGLADRCTFLCRDFLQLGDVGTFDTAIAIESFAHAPDPSRFFQEAARVLTPGGRLFLCDDFVTGAASSERERCLERLRRGWHFHSLLERDAVLKHAAAFRLARAEVLTPHLRLLSPLALSALERLGGALSLVSRSALVDNMIGGTALQQSERKGWTEYALLELVRA